MPWNHREGLMPEDAVELLAVRPSDRIAQLVFTRVARPEFAIVPALSATGTAAPPLEVSRGAGGFGSTGVEAACPVKPTARNSSP